MVNAEFSRIYRFVKLLVNEGFLAVTGVSFPTGKRKFVFIAYPVSIYRLLFLRSAQ